MFSLCIIFVPAVATSLNIIFRSVLLMELIIPYKWQSACFSLEPLHVVCGDTTGAGHDNDFEV